MEEKIIKMPKVELHLHLDGSVPMEILEKLSGLSKEEIIKNAVSHNNKSLKEYLVCFDFILKYMQTKEDLEEISYALGKKLDEENVIYAEIRFAPISHLEKGLTFDEVITSILRGLSRCKVKTNLILCLRRGTSFRDNMKVYKLAKKYLGKGVVAIDLVGDEDSYPFKKYKTFFDLCKKDHLPFTVHAGETTKRDLAMVLQYTDRIGHGIKMYDDNNLINLTKEKGALLEVCPKSNVDTSNVDCYENHPIKKLYEMGVNLSINTDNMTVSNVSLIDEYLHLYRTFHFTIDDFKKMNLYAINHAFLNNSEKEKLRMEVEKYE